MKTGFGHGFPHIPGTKYYKYHGFIRPCLIEPNPGPFLPVDTEPEYGPLEWRQYNAILNVCLTRSGMPYLEVHDNPVAEGFGGSLGQIYSYVGGYFGVGRYAVAFEVKGIGKVDKIEQAVMYLNPIHDGSVDDFNIIICNGMPNYPHVPAELGDYNKDNYNGNGGSMNTGDGHLGWIRMSAVGLSWIKRSGITKFYLVSENDINAIQPRDWEFVNYSTEEANVRLVIHFRRPV